MQIPLLKDILIILSLSVAVIYLFHKIKIPAIIGFLLTGILIGPHGFGIVNEVHNVDTLSEIGVILLLFCIGLELSLKDLIQLKWAVFGGGILQVFLTTFFTFIIIKNAGFTAGESIFAGFLISLSSTAIVLKILQERAEIESPQGRISFAILIFQDIIVVLMIFVTPFLSGASNNPGSTFLLLLLKGIGIIIFTIIGAKWIIPKLLYQIARTKIRELFLLSIVVICFAVAALTSSAGLSLSLGAFLAGMLISESEYSYQALSGILPFRDIFISFFFVSIGMLLNSNFLLHNILLIVLLSGIVIVFKSIFSGLVTVILGYPLRIAIIVGFALSQIGEFSFVLSKIGSDYGLLKGNYYQLFLSVSILTMAVSPFIISFAPKFADFIISLALPEFLIKGYFSNIEKFGSAKKKNLLKDHLIIIGFGVNGFNLSRAAKLSNIPYIIIEMNPVTVKNYQNNNEPIFFGDATQESVLQHACINEARIAVIAISDPAAVRRITQLIRKLNSAVYIIARTRFVQEMAYLYELGANEVIPEEFETSIEIFVRVLEKYLVPIDVIKKFIADIRADSYKMFRNLSNSEITFSNKKLHLPDVEINTLNIDNIPSIAGKSLSEIGLRKKYGITILAIQRGNHLISNIDGDTILFKGDTIYVLGAPNKIARALKNFNSSENEQLV